MTFSVSYNRRIFQSFKLFVVPVLIENGRASLYLPMIIDTGASYVAIRPDVFNRLGIRPARTAPLVTASETTQASLGYAERMTIGGHCSAPNIQVISIPLPATLPAEDLLGASFLRHFRVTIDYETGILELDTK